MCTLNVFDTTPAAWTAMRKLTPAAGDRARHRSAALVFERLAEDVHQFYFDVTRRRADVSIQVRGECLEIHLLERFSINQSFHRGSRQLMREGYINRGRSSVTEIFEDSLSSSSFCSASFLSSTKPTIAGASWAVRMTAGPGWTLENLVIVAPDLTKLDTLTAELARNTRCFRWNGRERCPRRVRRQ